MLGVGLFCGFCVSFAHQFPPLAKRLCRGGGGNIQNPGELEERSFRAIGDLPGGEGKLASRVTKRSAWGKGLF